MKKIIILLIGIIAIGGLTYFAINLNKTSKVSDDLSLIDFAVKDTAAIDKIVIYDSYSNEGFTVMRDKDKKWVDIDGNCVQQGMVNTMLETFLKVTLKGYVGKGAMENMKKIMMANHKKVEIYQNGKWVKTWYVGHPTSDHYGTHMLLETPKAKSDNPVIMGMKGFYGILEPRFSSDPKMYRCSQLFTFTREEIKSVEVVNNLTPSESFKIIQDKNGVRAFTNQNEIQNVNKDNLLFYLNGFKNIHFNRPNYVLSTAQIDSMKRQKVDYQLFIDGKDKSYSLDFYRRPDPDESTIDSLVWDPDYMWAIKPDGEVVRVQYFTFGPLLFGQDVFVENSVNN